MGEFLKKIFHKNNNAKPKCAAVVPAAGNSVRMGRDKMFLELNGEPVLSRTLRVLQDCPSIDEIVVATREDLILPIGKMCKDRGFSKVSRIVIGGATRTHSVLAGVHEVADDCELIAIHDGARPLVTNEIIERTIARAAQCGAAAPAVPVKDTIKQAENNLITATLDRSCLYAVQTPQIFESSLIRTALIKALADKAELTDDCSAVERLGIGVALTEGSYQNLKITTPEDIVMAEALLDWRETV